MKTLISAILSVPAATLSGALLAADIDWVDLGGETRTESKFDYTGVTVSYKNGTFNCNAGTAWFKNSTLNVGEGLVFNLNGDLSGATTAGGYELHVWDGGTLNVKKTLAHHQGIRLIVDEGGVLSTALEKTFKESSAETVYKVDVAGTYNALAGIGTATASASWKTLTVYLKPTGVINLSGNLTQEGTKLAVALEGGKLNVKADSTAAGISSFAVANDASVEICVDEGIVASYGNLKCGAGARLLKTGAGELALGKDALLLDVNEGALLLNATGAYDLSQVVFTAEAALKLGVEGLSVTAYDDSLLSVKKVLLDSALVADGIIAVTAPDETFAAWAAAAINAAIPEGFEASVNGLNVEVRTAFVAKTAIWTGGGNGSNWNDKDNWDVGTPVTGDEIQFGASTKLTTTDDIPGLIVSNVKFMPEAGAYTLGGTETLTVLGSIVNLSEALQTFQMPVAPSGQAVSIQAAGDIAFDTIASSATPLVKSGAGTVLFNKGFAGNLSIREGGVKVPSSATLASGSGALVVNGLLDIGGGTLAIVQPDSPVASIGDGAVLTNGTFNHSSEKPVYIGSDKTGRAFMWTNGTWTIAKDATVVTSGYLFEFGPDAPAETYGERRIVVDGGELRSTASGCKHVIGVDEDFSKPAILDLRNGALLKTAVAGEFHIGARTSGTGSSKRAKGVVVANDSSIELADQLRILNEGNESNSSGILAMTNSTLKLTFLGTTQWNDHHELNATGKAWTDAQMILNHTEASFYQLLANARVGSGMSAGKMVGVLTLDGATLKPVKATEQFVYNDQAATKTIELLAGGATVDAAYDITIPAIAYGVGGLVKAGAKTLTLPAANIYEGATVVNEGTLRLTGSVAGPLEIGANGTLEVVMSNGVAVMGGAASLSFAEGAKVSIDLTGLPSDKSYPFLLLKTGGTMSGAPIVEVKGSDRRYWKVQARRTAEGVLCSVAPQTGFVIMVY